MLKQADLTRYQDVLNEIALRMDYWLELFLDTGRLMQAKTYRGACGLDKVVYMNVVKKIENNINRSDGEG